MTPSRKVHALIAAVAGGNTQAFEELYRLACPKLYGLALRVLRQPDLAASAMRRAFIQVRADATRLSPQEDAVSFLVARLRAATFDIARTGAGIDAWEPFEVDNPARDPLALDGRSPALTRLLTCLGALPEERRRMLLLAYYDGWSREALAIVFDAPIAAVRALIARSVDQLAECLGKKPVPPGLTDADRHMAAEYALGTLDAGEREAVRARMDAQADFGKHVRLWERRLAPLHELAAPVAPPPGLWTAIAGDTRRRPVAAPAAAPLQAPPKAPGAEVLAERKDKDASRPARAITPRRQGLFSFMLDRVTGKSGALSAPRPGRPVRAPRVEAPAVAMPAPPALPAAANGASAAAPANEALPLPPPVPPPPPRRSATAPRQPVRRAVAPKAPVGPPLDAEARAAAFRALAEAIDLRIGAGTEEEPSQPAVPLPPAPASAPAAAGPDMPPAEVAGGASVTASGAQPAEMASGNAASEAGPVVAAVPEEAAGAPPTLDGAGVPSAPAVSARPVVQAQAAPAEPAAAPPVELAQAVPEAAADAGGSELPDGAAGQGSTIAEGTPAPATPAEATATEVGATAPDDAASTSSASLTTDIAATIGSPAEAASGEGAAAGPVADPSENRTEPSADGSTAVPASGAPGAELDTVLPDAAVPVALDDAGGEAAGAALQSVAEAPGPAADQEAGAPQVATARPDATGLDTQPEQQPGGAGREPAGPAGALSPPPTFRFIEPAAEDVSGAGVDAKAPIPSPDEGGDAAVVPLEPAPSATGEGAGPVVAEPMQERADLDTEAPVPPPAPVGGEDAVNTAAAAILPSAEPELGRDPAAAAAEAPALSTPTSAWDALPGRADAPAAPDAAAAEPAPPVDAPPAVPGGDAADLLPETADAHHAAAPDHTGAADTGIASSPEDQLSAAGRPAPVLATGEGAAVPAGAADTPAADPGLLAAASADGAAVKVEPTRPVLPLPPPVFKSATTPAPVEEEADPVLSLLAASRARWRRAAMVLSVVLSALGGFTLYRVLVPPAGDRWVALLQQDSTPALSVRLDPHEGVVRVQVMAPDLPAGGRYALWLVTEKSGTHLLSRFSGSVVAHSATLRRLGHAGLGNATLTVTVEPAQAAAVPLAPGADVVYRGRLAPE